MLFDYEINKGDLNCKRSKYSCVGLEMGAICMHSVAHVIYDKLKEFAKALTVPVIIRDDEFYKY